MTRLGSTAEFVHENLFLPREVLLSTIQGIWRKLSEGPQAAVDYLEPSAGKRSRLINEDSVEQAYLASLCVNREQKRAPTNANLPVPSSLLRRKP